MNRRHSTDVERRHPEPRSAERIAAVRQSGPRRERKGRQKKNLVDRARIAFAARINPSGVRYPPMPMSNALLTAIAIRRYTGRPFVTPESRARIFINGSSQRRNHLHIWAAGRTCKPKGSGGGERDSHQIHNKSE